MTVGVELMGVTVGVELMSVTVGVEVDGRDGGGGGWNERE